MFELFQSIFQSVALILYSVDCVWGDYSAWSACTKTCETGKQYKFRVIQTYETNGGVACDANKNVAEQECNTESCPGPGKSCSILGISIQPCSLLDHI